MNENGDGKEWLDTIEAGKMMGKTDRQVRRYARDGLLESVKDGKKLMVSLDSVKAFLEKNPQSDTDEGEEAEGQEDIQENNETDSDVAGTASEDTEEDTAEQADVQSAQPTFTIADDASALPEIQPELAETFKHLRESIAENHQRERRHSQSLRQAVDELESRLKFEQGRNEKIQEGLGELLQQLQALPEEVCKVSVDVRMQRFKRWLPWILFGISSGTALLLVF